MTLPQKIAAFLILVFAIGLRFWHFGEIQFSHDELSALLRTGYPDFNTLLEKGIKVDGHPAGVQVFLHYYTQWVGYEEWLVKLPFALAGVGTVLLIMASGWALQKPGAGLLAAACLAVMQHFVMYAQVARPYGMGLFFVSLAGYFWIRFFYQSQRWSFLGGFMLAAAAATYTHHFALLLVGLMGLSGLALLPVKKWPRYLLFNLGILVLYLPHLPVFFSQLSLGGIESWLAPPTLAFLPNYFQYLAHYSLWFGAALLLAVFLVWRKPQDPYFWPGLLWFGLSFLIGYAYSSQVSAVLQFSGLVFSAPFLLLFIFSRGAGARWLWGIPLILLVGSLSLYLKRQHYPYFYYSPFAKPIQEWQAMGNEALLLHHLDAQKLHFYATLLEADTSRMVRLNPEKINQQADSLLRLYPPDQILLALDESAPREISHLLQTKVGQGLARKNYFNFSLFTLAPKPDNGAPFWEPKDTLFESVAANAEFGASRQWDLTLSDTLNRESYFIVAFRIRSHHLFSRTEMASALYQNDSLISWETSLLKDYQQGQSFTAFHAFMAKPYLFNQQDSIRLKLFFYNHDRLPFEAQLQQLEIHRGNPKVYGKFYSF